MLLEVCTAGTKITLAVQTLNWNAAFFITKLTWHL
jgi:hypothetical protein